MKDLTDQQRTVLDFIRRFADREGYPPTRAEIAAGLGFKSINSAQCAVTALRRKGLIRVVPGISRGIKAVGNQ